MVRHRRPVRPVATVPAGLRKARYDTDPTDTNRAALVYALQLAVAAEDTAAQQQQAAEISGFPAAGVAGLMDGYYKDQALHDRRGAPLLDQ